MINATALHAMVSEAIQLTALPRYAASSQTDADRNRVEGGADAMIRAIAFTVGGVYGHGPGVMDAWSALLGEIRAVIAGAPVGAGYDPSFLDPYTVHRATWDIVAIAGRLTGERPERPFYDLHLSR